VKRRRAAQLRDVVLRPATARETKVMVERKLEAEREMWAFDLMPPNLRRAIADSATGLHASRLLADYEDLPRRFPITRAQVAQIMVENLAELEERNIRDFAERFERRYGWPYPHVAAGASVLRRRNEKDLHR
jgi:hypothetical protein